MWGYDPKYRAWIASIGGSYSSRRSWVYPAWLPKDGKQLEPDLEPLTKEERKRNIGIMQGYRADKLPRFEWNDLPFPAGADGIGWDGMPITAVVDKEVDVPTDEQLHKWIDEVALAGGDDSD